MYDFSSVMNVKEITFPNLSNRKKKFVSKKFEKYFEVIKQYYV